MTRVLMTLAGALLTLAVAAPASASVGRVTVAFGLSGDASPLYGGPASLAGASHGVSTSGMCRVRVPGGTARGDAVAVLEAAKAQGCIGSYALGPAASMHAGHLVAAVNGVGGRWVVYENGQEPGYMQDWGIEGYHAHDGDTFVLSLAPAKVGLPPTCCY